MKNITLQWADNFIVFDKSILSEEEIKTLETYMLRIAERVSKKNFMEGVANLTTDSYMEELNKYIKLKNNGKDWTVVDFSEVKGVPGMEIEDLRNALMEQEKSKFLSKEEAVAEEKKYGDMEEELMKRLAILVGRTHGKSRGMKELVEDEEVIKAFGGELTLDKLKEALSPYKGIN